MIYPDIQNMVYILWEAVVTLAREDEEDLAWTAALILTSAHHPSALYMLGSFGLQVKIQQEKILCIMRKVCTGQGVPYSSGKVASVTNKSLNPAFLPNPAFK